MVSSIVMKILSVMDKNNSYTTKGELQGVGESRVCCFIGVNAGALAPTDQGDTLRIIPGLGYVYDHSFTLAHNQP